MASRVALPADVRRGYESLRTDPGAARQQALQKLVKEASGTSTTHPVDRILRVVSWFSATPWIVKHATRVIGVPGALELVKDSPRDIEKRLWLGLRLKELEVVRERTRWRPSNPSAKVIGPVLKWVVDQLRPPSEPASTKLLRGTFSLCEAKLRDTPDDVELLLLTARLYAAAGRHDDSVRLTEIALSHDPFHGFAWYHLAESKAHLGDWAGARAAAASALQFGCSLGAILADQLAEYRWMRWHRPTRFILNPYHGWAYAKARAWFYAPAAREDVVRWLGPTRVRVRGELQEVI